MKKGVTISLLLLLFYTQIGYFGQFLLQQWRLKEAAREAWIAALPDAAFFRVSQADVDSHGKWEEPGRECWYNGHLYDVIRQKAGWLYCFDDDNEERLLSRSGELAHENHNKKTLPSFRMADTIVEPPAIALLEPVVCRHPWSELISGRLPFYCCDIVVPPPKG
ncbi:hypothetical protein ACQ86N_14750 [Puia sp. P3]|uniref:hypothetical protein n=1 Tax=Puia sp. P3 TaxID=3423952 RepID=UPI003D66B494